MSKIKMYFLKILCIQIVGNEKMIKLMLIKIKKEHLNKNTLFYLEIHSFKIRFSDWMSRKLLPDHF